MDHDHDHAVASGPDPVRPSIASSVWNAPLLVHVLVLVVVLIGVAAATSPPDPLSTDEGSYELQLRALADHHAWTWDAGTAEADPDGSHYPVAFSTQVDDGWVPLAKHPWWPWTAAQAAKVVGVDHAYDLLGSFAVVVAAVAAWFLAGARDRRLRRSAFWIAGLGPVTVTATFGWAHAVAAAAGGLAVLGAVRLTDRTRPSGPRSAAGPAVLVAVGVAIGILARSEGLLLAIAVAIAVPVAGRAAGRSWRWCAGSASAAAALAAFVYALEDRWVRSIIGSGSGTLTARSGGGIEASGFLDARLQGATRSLLDVEGRTAGVVLLLAVVGAAVAAALVVRGDRAWVARWHVAMMLVVVAFVFRILWMPDLVIRGMFAAWPILLVGVAAAGSLLWRRLLLESAVTVLFAAAILATQYADGGAIQWGGRFFAPLAVPLAVMVAVGVHRLLEAEDVERAAATDPPSVPLGRVLVSAVVVVPMVLGTWLCAHNRQVTGTLFAELDAHVEGVAITPNAQLPRMMWRYDIPWLVVDDADQGKDLQSVLAALHGSDDGPEALSLVLRRSDVAESAAALDDLQGWRETQRDDVGGITVVTLRR